MTMRTLVIVSTYEVDFVQLIRDYGMLYVLQFTDRNGTVFDKESYVGLEQPDVVIYVVKKETPQSNKIMEYFDELDLD